MTKKPAKNSVTVRLNCAAGKARFWPFHNVIAEEAGPDEEEPEMEEPQASPSRRLVQIGFIKRYHQHAGLKGYIIETKSTRSKFRVEFPCGAPKKTVHRADVVELGEGASERDPSGCESNMKKSKNKLHIHSSLHEI